MFRIYNFSVKNQVCDHRLSEGADEYLQLLDLSCAIMNSYQ